MRNVEHRGTGEKQSSVQRFQGRTSDNSHE
jgi:hypothetical protein